MRPTWAEIDLDNLAGNFRRVRRHVADQPMMAVVKADAYGHGAVQCAKRLSVEKVSWFGVALPEEAVELRENNILEPILCLGGFWAGQEKLVVEQRITPVVYRLDMAESLNRAALEANRIVDVHVKIDTGMNRLGVRFDQAAEFGAALRKFSNLRVDGLLTHFAAADETIFDSLTVEQISKFNRAVAAFRSQGFDPTWLDLANSPGALAHGAAARGNLVRIGGALYGIGKDIFPPSQTVESLQPVMSLRSEIVLLKAVPKNETIGYSCTFTTQKDSTIAVVPCGYNDGLPRALSNRGKVIVNDFFAPIVGRVSMDLIMLDVTDVPNVELFDQVILFGQSATKKISVEEIAGQAQTISYEITCGISKRVPRKIKKRET